MLLIVKNARQYYRYLKMLNFGDWNILCNVKKLKIYHLNLCKDRD